MSEAEHRVRRSRRLRLLCGVAPAVLAAILALYRPAFLGGLDFAAYDSIVRRSALRPPGGQVVIVDVDERSLAAIGQWPWRRDVIGQLIGRLREMGAATIAFDVMFAEPDRQPAPPDAASGARSDDGAHATAGAPRSVDAALAEALRDGGVVVGYALTFDNGGRGRSGCALHPIGLAVVQSPDEHA